MITQHNLPFSFQNLSIILFLGLLIPIWGWTQPKTRTWQQLEEDLINNPKPVVVFLHTDWCSYCLLMQRKTFQDPRVIQLLNEAFYFISFNAESKEEVYFQSKTYRFIPKGLYSGTHEWAFTLDENPQYPTLFLLDSHLQTVYKTQGYLKPDSLFELLDYYISSQLSVNIQK